jgi:hypothetical protein
MTPLEMQVTQMGRYLSSIWLNEVQVMSMQSQITTLPQDASLQGWSSHLRQ